MSSVIINNIKDIESYSYLELGVYDCTNFHQIKCNSKMSVDINGNAIFTGTTDDFFNSIPKDKKYDIIFIDANHDYDFVLRDFNNSVDHASKWILIHDMIPPTEYYTLSRLCSDSYRLLFYLLNRKDIDVYAMDENFGLTFIRMPAEKINPSLEEVNIKYEDFFTFISNKKLYSHNEMIEILNKETHV